MKESKRLDEIAHQVTCEVPAEHNASAPTHHGGSGGNAAAPIRTMIIITLAVLRWLLSLSGPQIKITLQVIIDVVCFGIEPDFSRISVNNRLLLKIIIDQILEKSSAISVENENISDRKTSDQKTKNRPRDASVKEGGVALCKMDEYRHPLLSKELKEKVKLIFFLKFFPLDTITYFENWLKANPEKCESEQLILQCADKWICNEPKDKWLWADRIDCRQVINGLKAMVPQESLNVLFGIVDIKTTDREFILVCRDEHSCGRISQVIGNQELFGRNVICSVGP